mmetsp:Transcript_11044/g.27974  ORF Transcript_11044/g.27974 Transcript_11044/m.27974 type:complete len:221 (+) Transcript_11044:97-759(+)
MSSSTEIPRSFATPSKVLSDLSPSMHAFAFVSTLLHPTCLHDTLRYPASSSTTRGDPPATTPNPPGVDGQSTTFPALNLPFVSCGTDPLRVMGTRMRSFFALRIAFSTATTTSFAFATPTPTLPFRLPTTTVARNESVFPPLHTLVTRCTCTTCSSKSSFLPRPPRPPCLAIAATPRREATTGAPVVPLTGTGGPIMKDWRDEKETRERAAPRGAGKRAE